ncbi:hypothetical protein FIBSPDRAFT_296881 [Athelia psychrophila]|uniref:Uncharacterized protein n=1 Tax=Athelia psychrophila TaxID=1759441 RepID=A0A167X988_9AGAM|nr:hypothetical protein FIBSPDRAFT_296881 [Fibularhizoctonia sp. CBS 109695]
MGLEDLERHTAVYRTSNSFLPRSTNTVSKPPVVCPFLFQLPSRWIGLYYASKVCFGTVAPDYLQLLVIFALSTCIFGPVRTFVHQRDYI